MNNWDCIETYRVKFYLICHWLGILGRWQGLNKTTDRSVRAPTDNKWRKSSNNWIKCNANASVLKKCPILGHGCIVKSHNGSFQAAHSIIPMGQGDPLLAKAMSSEEALKLAQATKMDFVILGSNAINIVNALNNSPFITNKVHFTGLQNTYVFFLFNLEFTNASR